MLSPEMAAGLPGTSLLDRTGEALGPIAEVFLNPGDDTPAWASVDAGTRTVVVPLLGAEPVPDGLRSAYAREQILEAPSVDAGGIDSRAQTALYAHYGISDAEMRDDSGFSADRPAAREQGTSRDPNGDSMVPGHP